MEGELDKWPPFVGESRLLNLGQRAAKNGQINPEVNEKPLVAGEQTAKYWSVRSKKLF